MNREKPAPVREHFLVFGSPQIEEAEIAEVVATLRSGWIGTGPKVAQFEQAFANYKGVDPACVAAVASCTAALHLGLLASGIGEGDEVITTPLTFCATINAIIHAGATPILADINPETMNIDPAQIEARLSPRTRAIVPVHFAGRPCAMDEILNIAHQYGLKIIEDCAHAIETEYKGKKAGTIGDFGCFSFYVTKNLTTGEGGMVITTNAEDIARVKRLALHGLSKDAWKRFSDSGYKHYRVEDCGFKYNMTDLQAAIGIHQLPRVEKNWWHRRAVWQAYQEAFQYLPIKTPRESNPNYRHAYHLYTVLINERTCGVTRDTFLDYMTDANIGVGVHYLSATDHPFYQRRFGWDSSTTPVASEIGKETVSLPLSAKLTPDDVNDVIETVKEFFNR